MKIPRIKKTENALARQARFSWLTLIRISLIVGILFSSQGSPAQNIIVFDADGSLFTEPASINASGSVAGKFFDSNINLSRGFVRKRKGTFTFFDPGAVSFFEIKDISPNGTVIGHAGSRGFMVDRDGTYTEFDIQGLPTGVCCVNAPGEILGVFRDFSIGQVFGFLRKRNGSVTIFDWNDVFGFTVDAVTIESMNAARSVTGSFIDRDDGKRRGFLWEIGRAFTVFDADNARSTEPSSINSSGTVAGAFLDDSVNRRRGFVRKRDGTFIVFEPDNSIQTIARDINNAGQVAGEFVDVSTGKRRGFVRQRNGFISVFDVGNSVFTQPRSINASGQVTGLFIDPVDGRRRGFLWER